MAHAEVSSESQKLSSTLNSSNKHSSHISMWESTCLRREIDLYRAKLSSTEASVAQLNKMKREIEEAFVEEEGKLLIQRRVYSETVKHLQACLQRLKCQWDETDEISPLKTKIMAQVESFRARNPSFPKQELSSLLKSPQSSLKPEERMSIKLEQIFMQKTSTEKSESSTKENFPLLERHHNDSAEQDQSDNPMISTLCEGVKRKSSLDESVSMSTKKLRAADEVESGSKDVSRDEPSGIHVNDAHASGSKPASSPQNALCLQLEEAGLSHEDRGKKLSLSNQLRTHETLQKPGPQVLTGVDEMQNTEKISLQIIKTEDSTESMANRIRVGASHYVIASDSIFFQIQWDDYYQKLTSGIFTCKKCKKIKRSRVRIVDHIWTQHFAGTFRCPYCPDGYPEFSVRDSFSKHMKNQHLGIVNRAEDISSTVESSTVNTLGKAENENKAPNAMETLEQDRCLKVGGYDVLPSHQKFFEIQWEKHYRKLARNEFICSHCLVTKSTKIFIEDHLWAIHCGGKFVCPHCAASFSYRYSVRTHILNRHCC